MESVAFPLPDTAAAALAAAAVATEAGPRIKIAQISPRPHEQLSARVHREVCRNGASSPSRALINFGRYAKSFLLLQDSGRTSKFALETSPEMRQGCREKKELTFFSLFACQPR